MAWLARMIGKGEILEDQQQEVGKQRDQGRAQGGKAFEW